MLISYIYIIKTCRFVSVNIILFFVSLSHFVSDREVGRQRCSKKQLIHAWYYIGFVWVLMYMAPNETTWLLKKPGFQFPLYHLPPLLPWNFFYRCFFSLLSSLCRFSLDITIRFRDNEHSFAEDIKSILSPYLLGRWWWCCCILCI